MDSEQPAHHVAERSLGVVGLHVIAIGRRHFDAAQLLQTVER
ncbi:hypothetical protein [Parolsenella catena]